MLVTYMHWKDKSVKNEYAHKYKHFKNLMVITDSERSKERNCAVQAIAARLTKSHTTQAQQQHDQTNIRQTRRPKSQTNRTNIEQEEPFPL